MSVQRLTVPRAGTVQVQIPIRVWGRMASEADHRGTTTVDLLVAAIHQVTHRSHRHATVIGLAVLGHTDRAIAELTGETTEFISRARQLGHVPAAKPGHVIVDEEQAS